MKASFFALILSFLFISTPLHAATEPLSSKAIVQQQNPSLKKINLNKADALALTGVVKGIGKKRAEAIVEYRKTHGEFKTLEELSQVKGLGLKFVKTHLSELEQVFILK